jgi:hypothetical protein
VVQEAISERSAEEQSKKLASTKGGRVGGAARAAKLSPDERRKIALKANRARWQK